MKRLLSMILCFTLFICAVATPGITFAETGSIIYGDGNGDGVPDAKDALLVLKIAVGKEPSYTADQATALDVDGNGELDAKDALAILKFAVNMITKFPVEDAAQETPDPNPETNKWLAMTEEELVNELSGETPATEISDAYKCHSDNGLIYNPLSREMTAAEKAKYNNATKTTGTLTLNDGSKLNYSVPTDVTAYDMVPVTYTLTNGGGKTTPLYVEATTFEEGNGKYYDLCLPGTVSLKFDYLGYVTADDDSENRPFLSNKVGSKDEQGTQFPQYNATDLVASDTLPVAQYQWFKFRITNTGDTILDGDGNGTFCFAPKLTGNGKTLENTSTYVRLTEDLYPGESTEVYFYFGSNTGVKLEAGDYTLSVACIVRTEKSDPAWQQKIWGGYTYGTATKTITVATNPSVTKKSSATFTSSNSASRNTWLHTYEEFTTSYDAWLEPNSSQTGTLWVQPAAWSKYIALKFMRGSEQNLQSVNIPLTVDTDSISITLNQTADNYIVTDEGTKYPAMASQSMCDMRVNITNSPYAAETQINELLDMKDCGVNLIATTEAFNIATASSKGTSISNSQDSIWFASDVIRKLGMRMEGYSGYPYNDVNTISAAYWYTRDRDMNSSGTITGYGNSALLGKANGLRALYQFMRWGDNYHVNSQNKVVINTEDTRGWMRIDYNARAVAGDETITGFRTWLKERYGTISKLNKTWGSSYKSFDDIEPENGTTPDHSYLNYTGSCELTEWSTGLNDWDIYRTLERTENYKVTLDTLKNYSETKTSLNAVSVDATMSVRTEGGNLTGIVDYNTTKSHLRHMYYSQRRCALIPQLLAKSGTVTMHSDYVTLPYSVSELEEIVSSSTSIGITSMPLFQANRMRDIAINDRWGDEAYEIHYNLTGDNTCGAYISTQVSVFEAFKAVYENGGIPGLLWEDYLCDGYVTETQQKEMKFYSSKIAEMMETAEAQTWATTDVQNAKAVQDTSVGAYSYPEAYIQSEIDKALAKRK